ncbi:hypothetical protein C4565_01265 [Candidatus Parcubacteria bacterium]|jgi:Tfp pilus assembly protein PilO|nr:MAG: hypothetical protein C4565_01265 [Candidatus Parcubacteria bacterium]
MRASSKRVMSIGIAAMFLIGVLIVYGSFIRPAYSEIETKRAELSAAENLFNNQKNATEQVNKAFIDMKNATKVREVISQALPVGPNMTQALHQIESVVRSNKVNIDALTIREAPSEANKQILAKRLGKLGLNFSVSGTYESVRDFVRALETNVRVTNITNFEFSSGSSEFGGGSANLYTLQIVAEMYYQEN